MSEAVDSLIDTATHTVDGDERWALYREAERLIIDDAPWIFLWFPIRYEAVSARLEGYRLPLIFNAQRFLEVSF